jgi:tetratricopeptide (TPR) repeat protein
MGWLEAERASLIGMVELACELEEWKLAALLSFYSMLYFRRRSYWKDWQTVGELGLKAGRFFGDESLEAVLLAMHGNLLHSQGRWKEAIDQAKMALAIVERIEGSAGEAELPDDTRAMLRMNRANVLSGIALSYMESGLFDEAAEYFARALEIERGIQDANEDMKDTSDMRNTLNNFGVLRQRQKRWDEANVLFSEALRRAVEVWGSVGRGHH